MQITKTSNTEECIRLWIQKGHIRVGRLINQALWSAGFYFIDSWLEEDTEVWEYRRRAIPYA